MHWDDIPPVVNYLRVHAPSHPLASPRGHVPLHRWLLYRRLGPGPHPCHWCGVAVDWIAAPVMLGALITDHVDGNRGNNEESNLVPACHGCTIWRARGGPIPEGALTVRLNAGPTRAVQRTCVECGATFLTRRQRGETSRYCSRACQWEAEGRARRVPDDEPHVLQTNKDGTIKARVRAVELTCEYCGAAFLVDHARLRKGVARFCSQQCSGKVSGPKPKPSARGNGNHHAALTEADVREMRRLWAAGGITLEALGARFGVSKSGANMVVYRRSWKHVV